MQTKMAVSLGSPLNGLLTGRCPCNKSQKTDPRLTNELRTVQFQKLTTCIPVPFRKSNSLPRTLCCPRNALDSADSDSKASTPSDSQRPEDVPSKSQPVPYRPSAPKTAQNALARAAAYRQSKKKAESLPKAKSDENPAPVRPKDAPEVEIFRGNTFQSRLQSTDANLASTSPSPLSPPSPTPPSSSGGDVVSKSGNGANTITDSVVQAEKDNAGGASVEVGKLTDGKSGSISDSTPGEVQLTEGGETLSDSRSGDSLSNEGAGTSPGAGKASAVSIASLAAINRAKAYKAQQAEMIAALKEKPAEAAATSSSSNSTSSGSGENLVEVEIVTRDGVIKKLVNPEKAFSNVKEFKRTGVSSIDFSGLGFADKKQSGKQVIREDYIPPPPGALPEVEIITKDAETTVSADGEDGDLYKPRVSTWGVFPRPADISKAYGGGRTIRPGDPLETEEEKIAREAKTQKLLADYKKKMGLDVDPRVVAECQKIMKQGDLLMDRGDLKEALLRYEAVMEKMIFQSELHGLAALQGAICLDSAARFDEARQTYEKLISHPNGKIRKQAKQLLYGFRAMENLKVSLKSKWDTSAYQNYFESFSDGYNTTYKASEDEPSENILEQTLVYALLLFFPILLVIVLAISKGNGS